MRQIDIDFDVWKALTAQLQHEKHTYNDVLRLILGLDSVQEPAIHPDSTAGLLSEVTARISDTWVKPSGGFFSRGLFLPDGTKIRARYKGVDYFARIENGQWLDEKGRQHQSPSSAATAITKNSVNGWRFWEAIRPNDTAWRRLDMIS